MVIEGDWLAHKFIVRSQARVSFRGLAPGAGGTNLIINPEF